MKTLENPFATLEEVSSMISTKINVHNPSQKKELKANFLTIILSKNKILLQKWMVELNIDEALYSTFIIHLALENRDPLGILNSPLFALVQAELAHEDAKALTFILLNAFQSIPELSHNKSGICLSMREKKILLRKLLANTNASTKNSVLSVVTDLSYDAILPAFRPSIGDRNYVPMKITPDQYLKVINRGIDPSIFICLSIGYLKSNHLATQKFLQKLMIDYVFVKYESCIQTLEQHLESLAVPSISQTLIKFDYRFNDTRRFFETRLAQYINGLKDYENTL
jgi:hypothetical protein